MRRTPIFALGSGIALVAVLALSASAAAPALADANPDQDVATSAAVTAPSSWEASADLGTAGAYSVLAAAALTAPASTMLPGQIGAGAAMTFSATVYADDAVQSTDDTTSALSDLSYGYAALQGLTAGPLPGGADLGGQILTPGVYSSTSALADTSTLTFDAQDDPDAVFVIQSAAAINTTAATKMVLVNGANACNIYWVSAAATTLGAASEFDGNIVSYSAITVGAGTTVHGRALSVNAAITLDANDIGGCGSSTGPINDN